ncbi:MAG: prenyltransferase [Anaerolineales bacterium]|jgi:1,4-dihydroxy-2-naphthoate octaprenyltransferase
MKIRESLRDFIRLSRPHFLLGGVLLFALGAAIANYLGEDITLYRYLLGQGFVTAIQLMGHYLNEYHDAPVDNLNQNRTPFNAGSGALGPDGLPRSTAFYAAIVMLTLSGTLAGIMLLVGDIPLLTWIFALLGFLGAYSYSAPPLRTSVSGYGELITSVVVAGFVPSFSFSLFAGDLHRLIFMSTVPLIAFHFAMMLVFELPDYATDLKYEKQTLMVRLGWETGMRMHDYAILFGVLSFITAFLNGLPGRVALGGLIVLPLALAQIWQMNRIRSGFPPHWRVITVGALLLFGLSAYFITLGFILS